MKQAIVHYWLTHMRGGEKVLAEIATMLPAAELLAHVIDPKLLSGPLAGRVVKTTFINQLPLARQHYAMYLPLMPLALEIMDMSGYDLIVSSEAGPAKWVIANPDAQHVCYCHSPLRYIWDQKEIYLSRFKGMTRLIAEAYASQLRRDDFHSSTRVDTFVANSNFVAKRIWKYYRREADVVHPPVDVDRFTVSDSPDDFYLLAGEIRAYKGAETAIKACAMLDRRLVVVGGGDHSELAKLAGPKTVFLGRVDDREFASLLSQCRALLFPGVEDFGIVPVEAMAAGRPVIALAKGGALDSVIHGETGLLYQDASVDGLKAAIEMFEAEENGFKPANCVTHARRFRPEVFRSRFAECLPSGALTGTLPEPVRPRELADAPASLLPAANWRPSSWKGWGKDGSAVPQTPSVTV